MSPKEAIRRLERLDIDGAVTEAIEATADEFLSRQREQFAAGERSDGSFLPPYSESYAAQRRREGLQTAVMDLRRTGEFYRSMLLEAYPDVVNITSDVDYEKYISRRFNDDNRLYGLNETNLSEYRRESFFPALKGEVEAQTGLTFSA